jgi:TRAP-type C4-dicarboxylate transport system permease large subunit
MSIYDILVSIAAPFVAGYILGVLSSIAFLYFWWWALGDDDPV